MAVRYLSGERVQLVWARPNPGYEASVRSDGGDYVLVRFSNGKHRSWVSAYYENGRPQKKVLEADDSRNDGYSPSSTSYNRDGYRWSWSD